MLRGVLNIKALFVSLVIFIKLVKMRHLLVSSGVFRKHHTFFFPGFQSLSAGKPVTKMAHARKCNQKFYAFFLESLDNRNSAAAAVPDDCNLIFIDFQIFIKMV